MSPIPAPRHRVNHIDNYSSGLHISGGGSIPSDGKFYKITFFPGRYVAKLEYLV